MNALAKEAEGPTMLNVPIRGQHRPAESCRIVTETWFEENEAQIRHLFQVAQGATRENVTLKEAVDKSRENVRVLVSWYRDAVIVREGGGPIDYDASLAVSFSKLIKDRNRKSVALSELVDLKKLKDSVGKTPEYEQRQPAAWIAAIEALKSSSDNEEVVADAVRIRELETENVALRAATRHLEQNEADRTSELVAAYERISGMEVDLAIARREREDARILEEAKERKAKAYKEELERTYDERDSARERLAKAFGDITRLTGEVEDLRHQINTPETVQFLGGVTREAAHQRQKWGTEDDKAKAAEDWFWLLGYLAGKACRYFAMAERFAEIAEKIKADPGATSATQGVVAFVHDQARQAHEKGIHHLITTAAACANWHLNARGIDTSMSAGRDFQKDEEPEGAGPHTLVSTIGDARDEADRIAGAAYAVERAAAHQGEVVDAEFHEVGEKPPEARFEAGVVVTP